MTVTQTTAAQAGDLRACASLLDDLLVEDLPAGDLLQQSLGLFLEAAGFSDGAIYIPDPVTAGLADREWITFRPGAWNGIFPGQGDVFFAAAQRAVRTGQVESVDGSSMVIYPLHYRSRPAAALLLPAALPEPDRFAPLFTALARLVVSRRKLRSAAEYDQLSRAFQLIAGNQTDSDDANEVQFQLLGRLGRLFSAEEALLVLLDEENPQIAVKKRLSLQRNWAEMVNQPLDNSVLNRCIQEQRFIEMDKTSTGQELNPLRDLVLGLEVENVLCAPLSANGQHLGVLALINVPPAADPAGRQRMFQTLASAVASMVFSAQLLLQFKISYADLEASRWELLNSRNTLRTLFDSIPESMYIVDASYILLAVNHSRALRAEEKPNQLVGKRCYECLYQRTSPCPGCRVTDTLTSGRTTQRIGQEWLAQDRLVEWEINTFPIYNENNRPVQAIVREQDVTEKRSLEANLIQSEKLAAVGQLAAGIAHEINNPLAAVIANSQILKRQWPDADDDVLESLALIETAGTRAAQVVRNLLGIARKEKYDFAAIDLNETVTNALSLVQHEIMERPVVVEIDLQQDLPPILASRDHLQGVWINLVLNALDALDGQSGRITVTSRWVNNEYRICVADNGLGIPQERAARIFEPFFTTKIPGRGTGLGLSVSLRAVKQHGGNILVESQPGEGTRFTVVLPARQEDAAI